jgi:hypothetical protein
MLDGFITEGSRTAFLPNDQIVISYPGRPALDQVIMFGGGSYQSSRSNGYPDDTNSEVTFPPDFVEFSGASNIGDNVVYNDARTTYIANLDERRGNQLDFTFVSMGNNGANNAPVPCISGQLVITDYTRDSIGGISNFPNFLLLNRSNAFRFKTSYEQNQNEIGRPFSFLGRWSQLDPIKSSNGEPIEGINSWKGAKIYHYGGIKPAPEGHADNPYVMSSSVIYFGGFTRSDFTGYYSNSLLIINALDVNLGWSLIENETQDAPTSRAGNGIMVVNRQIENPEKDTENIQNNIIDDTKAEVWITCGNNSDLDNTTYDQAKSLNDTWLGRLSYQKRMVNAILPIPISFVKGTQDYQAVADINLNSALGAFMVPNGLRTSNNLENSIQMTASNKYHNDRYTDLSINDPSTNDYFSYNGSLASFPNWISPVQQQIDGEISGDSRTEIQRAGTYFPADLPPLGERRWTAISRLVVTIPEGPGSGDHDVFVGIYNNGIKSVVEYFLPDTTQFAFNLAFIELSGGLYDDNPDNPDGKSWIDVGTGNLHLQIRNILNQPLGDLAYPYISSVNNTNFVELVGVKWSNMTSEIGVKPLKNTWGALVSDSFNANNIAYFGGRTHNKILLKNTFKWNPPSIYVENEKSDLYSLSEIDGSTEDKWLTLKHGNIVKTAATAELGDIIDHNVSWRNSYSAWGVAKLIFKTSILNDIAPNNRRPVYYVGFNIIPSVRPYDIDGTQSYSGQDLDQGLGFIQFESINYPIGLQPNVDLTIPLIEGQLNYQTGKISIRLAQDLFNYSQNVFFGECTNGTFTGGQYFMGQPTGTFYPPNIASHIGTLYAIVTSGINASTTAHQISSIIGNTVTFVTPFAVDEQNVPILFSTSPASLVSSQITEQDILFEIEDINYHTYESPLKSYYNTEDFSGTVTRNIGDKVGGEYSSRIDSWVYTEGASIDATDISSIQDDRALTINFDVDDYSISKKLIITDGNVAAPGNTFTSALSAWLTTLQPLLTNTMILYIPTQGYYKILSVSNNTTLLVDTTGPYGSLSVGTSLDAIIFGDMVSMTDVKADAFVPNDVIFVPRWMDNEMRSMHAIYNDGNSAVIPNSNPLNMISDLYNASNVTPGIINVAENNEIWMFGKLIFNKKKALSTDDDIEYYQYFLKKTSTSSFQIVGGDQIILKINGSLQSYNAETDVNGYNIPYVTAISEGYNSLSQSEDISYTFGIKGDDTLGSIANVTLETDTLYLNDSLMKIPTEVVNPDTYMQWQGTSIKVLFSFDEGLTWKKYDTSSDIWLAVNAKDIISNGMEFNDLFDIISWQWSGWNNSLRSAQRNLPQAYLGFIEGSTSTIKMLVGLFTEEPSKTPAIDGIVFNTYTGGFWEPKNFYQDGNVYGTDSGYLQVKMLGPVSTKVVNRHATSTKIRQLKATIMINS